MHESQIIPTLATTLSNAQLPVLACAYVNVLLHFSQHVDNASQMVGSTPLLSLLPSVLQACHATLKSALVPAAIDLLWNLLETMPQPRQLPDQVRLELRCRAQDGTKSISTHCSPAHCQTAVHTQTLGKGIGLCRTWR